MLINQDKETNLKTTVTVTVTITQQLMMENFKRNRTIFLLSITRLPTGLTLINTDT